MTLWFFLGGILASLSASFIFNHIGRIKTYIILGILEIIASLLALILNLNVLYTIRFIHGYVGCFYTYLCSTMLNEIIP